MKNNNYIFGFIALITLFTACNDEFLERAPLVSMSDANFWVSANDLRLYANNWYNQDGLLLRDQGVWFSQGPYGQDADNGSDTQIPVDYNRRMNGENILLSSGGGWASGDWTILRNINYFMDHYDAVEEPWDNIKQYVAEAHFFRAIFYFSKLRLFGDVPWASTTVAMDTELLFSPRIPRNQVVDNIMDDLDHAIEYLPERGGGNWTGRVTKEAALALQARIALFEGTWERYHARKNTPFSVSGSDGTKFIQKAADAAAALIALAEANGYPALDNINVENGYWSLFNQFDYSNHKEVILWRKYSIEEGQYTRWGSYTSNGGARGLTKKMIDSYLCIDGKPIAVSPLYQGDATLQSVVANRDPRLNQTIFVDDSTTVHLIWDRVPLQFFATPTFESTSETRSVTGYQNCKGHNPYDYAGSLNGGAYTQGHIYFRYAETLLIYAEAKAELGTITQSDIDKSVNALRGRVGMPGLNSSDITFDPNWEFTDLSPLLQEIRRERKVELACEGFRVDDIFRWAAADELIAGKRPLGAVKQQWENYPEASELFLDAVNLLPVNDEGYIDPYKPFSELDAGFRFNLNRDYLLPIPTTELLLNSNLTQNPGW